MNTKINLMYRDGDNYKAYKEVVLAGAITAPQIASIKSKLDDGEYLIANQVGLPTPREELIGKYGFDEHTDHVYTTMSDFFDGVPTVESMLTDDAPTEDFSIDELAARFKAVGTWDVSSEWDRMLEAA